MNGALPGRAGVLHVGFRGVACGRWGENPAPLRIRAGRCCLGLRAHLARAALHPALIVRGAGLRLALAASDFASRF